MKNVRVCLVTSFVIFAQLLTGCGASSSPSSPGSSGTVVKANLSAGAKGLVNSSSGSRSAVTDSLMQMTASNDLQTVTFKINDVDPKTGVTTSRDQTLNVQKIKNLSSQYVALSVNGFGTLVLDKTTGNIYGLGTAVDIDESQMNGTKFYYLNSSNGQLEMVDISDPTLTINNVNDVNGSASNTGFATAIYSELNAPSSPFSYLGINQVGEQIAWLSPSFIFTASGLLAMAGPYGGRRVMYFPSGQSVYDCQMSEFFTHVGGGASGGVFQTSNQDLYQIEIINSAMAANAGDALIKFPITATGNCWSRTVALQLNTTSNFAVFSPQTTIDYKTNYLLTDVKRYVLNPSGFLKTFLSGGNPTMTWTALNLSTLPVEQPNPSSNEGGGIHRLVVVDGDYVYWLSSSANCSAAAGTDYGTAAIAVCQQALTSGGTSPASMTFSPVNFVTNSRTITNFDVVKGVVVITDSTGTYSVASAGATPVLASTNVGIPNAVAF